jgi:hypothetical protein
VKNQMNDPKISALIGLSHFVDLLDQPMQGDDLDFDNRLWYGGHMVACAKIFRSIHLNDQEKVLELLKIESMSYRIADGISGGRKISDAWLALTPILQQYALSTECS